MNDSYVAHVASGVGGWGTGLSMVNVNEDPIVDDRTWGTGIVAFNGNDEPNELMDAIPGL